MSRRKPVEDLFPGSMRILIYTGNVAGTVSDKAKVFLGYVRDLPELPPNRRYNVRIRGKDETGQRILPVCCRARTDEHGRVILPKKIYAVPDIIPEPEPVLTVKPLVQALGDIINRNLYQR